MLRVDLLCDKDNRILLQARNRLMAAFRNVDLPAHWHEWDIGDAKAPNYIRGRKGVAVFVNGGVVLERRGTLNLLLDPSYRAKERLPTEEQITEALLRRHFWPRAFINIFPQFTFLMTVLPFLVLSLMPSFGCPFCWPGYASGSGWFYSNTLGWHYFSDYFFSLGLLSLTLGLGSFLSRSYSLNDYLVFLLALTSGVLILTGKSGGLGPVSIWLGIAFWVLSIVGSLHLKAFYGSACQSCNSLTVSKRCA